MTWSAMNSLAGLSGYNERDHGAMIQDYLKNGGVNLNPAQTAWCAAVVNAALKQTGLEGTGSNMARSFLSWGQGTTTPKPGDIAVFSRGDPNSQYGHVGFFQGYDDNGNIRVLGGNQSNSVNVSAFSPSNLLGFRTAGEGQTNYGPEMPTLASTAAASASNANTPQLDGYGKGMQAVTKGLMGLAMMAQKPSGGGGGGLLGVPQMKAGPSGGYSPLRINGREDDPFNQFS